MINLFFLILAFLMTFFMVGFVLIELFFSKLSFRIKFPLYIVTSLVFSTLAVYLVALQFGLTRGVVLITFLPFLPPSIFFWYRLRKKFLNYINLNIGAVILIIGVSLIYFIALNPAILGKQGNYLVMSGVNWQDTALHLSITQSLTQGNFPPQAPYFSGAPLSYYYFTDLHSAIIALFYGQFFPRVFVYDNALLAGVLALSLYSLAFELSKNRKLAIISTFIGSFYGSFIFWKFFRQLITEGRLYELLTNNTYSMEYRGLFGMANMADYYLQNRPMMLGLPIVVTTILLIIYAFKKRKIAFVLLIGLMSASLVKIQLFCLLAVIISFVIIPFVYLKRLSFKFLFRSYLLFFLPILIFYLIFGIKSVNGANFIDLVLKTFGFGPLDNTRTIIWMLGFILLNLGLPFIITIISFFVGLKRDIKIISALSILFVSIPLLVTFTIDGSDMFKFFYFACVIFAVITPIALRKIFKKNYLFKIVMSFAIFTSTLSSFLTLTNSFLNKNSGYSLPDYEVGLWIRNNTPENSVFVTTTSVHSPPTDFGGRLRVISYTNWPYTHGFSGGNDNVFSRAEDVTYVYNTGDISQVKLKYNANYIFYGEEEQDQFPESGKLFDFNSNLRLVYSKDNIKIYAIF